VRRWRLKGNRGLGGIVWERRRLEEDEEGEGDEEHVHMLVDNDEEGEADGARMPGGMAGSTEEINMHIMEDGGGSSEDAMEGVLVSG